MKALLIEHDKTESIIEVDPLTQNETRNLRLVQDCFKIVDGERLLVYVRRVYEVLDEFFSRELKREFDEP